MTLLRRGSAKKKHDDRRTWLAQRPDLYQHVPGIHDDVTDIGVVHLTRLVDQMRALEFLGSSTAATQRETVRRLVSELRGEHIGGGW